MKKVRVLCVGKTKESYLNTGLDILTRKISHYCNFSTVIIKEAKYASGNRQQWLKFEADGISKHLNNSHYTIICDEKGKQMSSVVLAKSFMKWANQGVSHFDFVIGGAFGISDALKKQANLVLSFSQMTMTHQMFRLFLYEQLYRSYTIINGEKYHHN